MIKISASSHYSVTSVKGDTESTFHLPSGTTRQDAQNTAYRMLKNADTVAYNREATGNRVMIGRFGRVQPGGESE